MIIGIGCDVIELSRFAQTLKRTGDKLLSRLFTPSEIAYCMRHSNPIPHFAGRFAAKEALSKALGIGIGSRLSWQDMEILPDSQGRPMVLWHLDIIAEFHVTRTHLSISHSETIAIAQAVLE